MITLNKQYGYLEHLPSTLIGKILKKLDNGGYYEPMKSASSLACTNKCLRAKLNKSEVVLSFIQSCSSRYQESFDYCAALWITPGTRRYFKHFIRANRYDKTYRIIQNIYDIVADVFKEASNSKIEPHPIIIRKHPSYGDTIYDKTKKGFTLCLNGYAVYLGTPFGKVELYTLQAYDDSVACSLIKPLIKRMNCVIEKFYNDDWHEYIQVASSGNQNIRKVNSKEITIIKLSNAKKMKGEEKIIYQTRTNKSFTIYKIRKVNKKVISELKWNFKSEFDQPIITRCWNLLEEKRLGGVVN
jgi:hypothetical protein